MHFEKKHFLNFYYQKKEYRLSVDQLCLPGGNTIFKIEMPTVRYWLICRNEQWKFMADIPPDNLIRCLLIRKINSMYLDSKVSAIVGSYVK